WRTRVTGAPGSRSPASPWRRERTLRSAQAPLTALTVHQTSKTKNLATSLRLDCPTAASTSAGPPLQFRPRPATNDGCVEVSAFRVSRCPLGFPRAERPSTPKQETRRPSSCAGLANTRLFGAVHE